MSFEEAEEIKRRRQIAELQNEDEKRREVERLRETSRQMYLKKREGQVIRDTEEAIRDEDYLFRNENITEAERQRAMLRKKELQIVKDLHRDRDREVDQFVMLDDEFDDRGRLDKKKKWAKLTARFNRQEEERATVMNTEQKEWEDHQIAKTQLSYGAKKASSRSRRGDGASTGSILDDTQLLERTRSHFSLLLSYMQLMKMSLTTCLMSSKSTLSRKAWWKGRLRTRWMFRTPTPPSSIRWMKCANLYRSISFVISSSKPFETIRSSSSLGRQAAGKRTSCHCLFRRLLTPQHANSAVFARRWLLPWWPQGGMYSASSCRRHECGQACG